jgi:hypothetical protein
LRISRTRGDVDDRQQQVLDRQEFMAGFAGLLEGLVQTVSSSFEFASSTV